MMWLMIVALAMPPCAAQAAVESGVECKLSLAAGERAPFSGVLLTEPLALGIAQDIATLEAAVHARDRLITAAREERDTQAELYAEAVIAGDRLAAELDQAARSGRDTWSSVAIGVVMACSITLAFVGGAVFGAHL